MSDEVAARVERSPVAALAAAVLVGVWLRLFASVVAGIIGLAESHTGRFPNDAFYAGDLLVTFGGAGDGTGVLLCLTALALVWLLRSMDEPTGRLLPVTRAAFELTVASAFAQVVGFWLLFSLGPEDTIWSSLVLNVGSSLAIAVVALGGLTATKHLPAFAGQTVRRLDDQPAVFAVDRRSGEVRAYLSLDEAERKVHVFSVEDDEFAFYTDDGMVVRSSVEHDRVHLQPTDLDQGAVLVDALRAFAGRTEIVVDAADRDDPMAYVGPVADWQWLQLWPGWLRWVARLLRPR